MIIKNADSKEDDIATLKRLLSHPRADAATKKRIEQELRNIQSGMRGEQEAAYEMQARFGDSANWMVIHDLRIEHAGVAIQLDHVLINRWLEIRVCESKRFSEGISINEHGEFCAFHASRPYGIGSPIEQNRRHVFILQKLFDSGAIKLPTRLGFTIKPDLKSLILVSKNARISRPDSKIKVDGIETVIKNDQLWQTIDKQIDDGSPLALAKVVSSERIEELGKALAALHHPIVFNWAAKFGLTLDPLSIAKPEAAPPTDPVPAPGSERSPTSIKSGAADTVQAKTKQKLECISCKEAVPYNVAKFCWFNKPRFGGNLYCVECQRKVAPV